MYSGFFVHSPRTAHLSQLSCIFVQFPLGVTILSNESTWIHLVADHFSPSITGHPPWRLNGSGIASGWRLKNNKASPFLGFTDKHWPYRHKRCLISTCLFFLSREIRIITIYFDSHQQFLSWHNQKGLLCFQRVLGEKVPIKVRSLWERMTKSGLWGEPYAKIIDRTNLCIRENGFPTFRHIG